MAEMSALHRIAMGTSNTHWIDQRSASEVNHVGASMRRRKSMPDPVKRSIIHIAAETGNVNMCRLLIQHQGGIDSKDGRGFTPLHLAARAGNAHICWLLLQQYQVQRRNMQLQFAQHDRVDEQDARYT
jgi:ankyrin repeat protein